MLAAGGGGIVVVGTGPCGLGAAWRLNELGFSDWRVLEASQSVAGLAGSELDAAGFLWDFGGHVIFSHYAYYDAVMNECTPPDQWNERRRAAFVWMRDRFIGYPFQMNCWQLPPDDVMRCIDGLLELQHQRDAALAAHAPAHAGPRNFDEHCLAQYGRGMTEIFFRPYNAKVWAIEPSRLSPEWVGERVAPVDLRQVLHGMVHKHVATTWGPNSVFRYPRVGGTGGLWQRAFERLPRERFSFGAAVTRVHLRERSLELADGQRVPYTRLVSTMPLDELLRACVDLPAELAGAADALVYSGVHVVGLGIDQACPAHLSDKCWMYFPEDVVPAFRITVFSNYSDSHVPRPGAQYSLMCEVSESASRPVDAGAIVAEMEAALRATGFIAADAVVLSRFHKHLVHGYPTPFVGRTELVERCDRVLRGFGVYSRGRFGGWKYEVSNQDHSFMQGVECAARLVAQLTRGPGSDDSADDGPTCEPTFYTPSVVNAPRPRAQQHHAPPAAAAAAAAAAASPGAHAP